MSTVANTKTKTSGSASATVFISVMALGAAVMLADGILQADASHLWKFAGLLLAGALTARLKVKLPGLNGNMSVSLPFLLIAMTRLSLLDTVLTAAVSVFLQSIPKAPHKFNPIHALFNVSTAIVATGMGWQAFHRAPATYANATTSLLLGCVVYVLASTLPVAGIISFTEHQGAWHTWSEIVQLTFPYYVASTGLASIASPIHGNATWSLLVGTSLVAIVMYRSFHRYFAASSATAPIPTTPEPYKAKSASAAA